MKFNEQQNCLQFVFGNYNSAVFISKNYDLTPIFNVTEQTKILPVFDTHTAALFNKVQHPAALPAIVLSPGEEHKSWESINTILQKAVEYNLSRDSLLVGVGGGIVCDLVSFAASTYMRGCQLKLIPTTLLAMVDASLGGKTGINFMGYKNLVGTFYPAAAIHMCLATLDTLPEIEFKNGLAEVIKTAMLGDEILFQLLVTEKAGILERDSRLLEELVRRCIMVKGKVVEEDLMEKGRRALLNLGHTFGHALEAVAHFKDWSHGQAVAWGIAKALDLGLAMGLTNPAYAGDVKQLLTDYGFRTTVENIDPEQILAAMAKDKKKLQGKLRFIIPRALCQTEIVAVDADVAKKVIN